MAMLKTTARGCAVLAAVLLAGCAWLQPPTLPPVPKAPPAAPPAAEVEIPETNAPRAPIEAVIEDPMVVHRGDQPLPRAKGKVERIDCRSGDRDLQARIALEARGNQVMNFAYYSRWKFQTCSIHFGQDSWDARWRLTKDGATRVQTPYGSFLIRADKESYRFEFQNVERMKFCGMYGQISGELVVKRRAKPPKCEARGILDL